MPFFLVDFGHVFRKINFVFIFEPKNCDFYKHTVTEAQPPIRMRLSDRRSILFFFVYTVLFILSYENHRVHNPHTDTYTLFSLHFYLLFHIKKLAFITHTQIPILFLREVEFCFKEYGAEEK